MPKDYEVAAYYFPNYHADARNEARHGQGWSEWELVKRATPRFAGHQQPKVPLWGYEDEANAAVMEKKIDAAADHGIDVFIFDWYWYDDGPYLQRALEEGYLQAGNNRRLKFAVFWANHDWIDIHPAQRSRPANVLAPGRITRATFVDATDHMIERYFNHPSYWKVNGGLYFSVNELMTMIDGFGGITNTRAIFDDFRDRVRAAGLGELHLNAVVYGIHTVPGEIITEPNEMLDALGFDSITSYIWVHHQPMPGFPETDYAEVRERSIADWTRFTDEYKLPYYPNVTMGWDPSPRTIQSDVYDFVGYPYTPILKGNTPEAFEHALRQVKHFLDQGRTLPKICSINAWNEWTEGSYLEPDVRHGMRYLEAVKHVFGA